MSTYLITGGAGFIGSNLAEELLQRGHQVRVVDDFSTGRWENIRPFEREISLFEQNIASYDSLQEAFLGVDYVLHQAALPSVPRSIEDPTGTFRSNVEGTINVLEICRATKVKKLVFASSSSIYGSNPDLPKHESMYPAPLSPYAASKLAAETYCQVYHKVYGLPTVCLRYFNVFGPHQDPDSQYAAVIPKFIRAALQDEILTIFGDGEQTRDFTFISNIIRANILAAESDVGSGQVFNVACGERISLNKMVDIIEDSMGRKVDRLYESPRPGDVPHSQADISRFQSTFGFEPETSFSQGMLKTLAYFKQLFIDSGGV